MEVALYGAKRFNAKDRLLGLNIEGRCRSGPEEHRAGRVLVCAEPLKHLQKQGIFLPKSPSQKLFQSAIFFFERSECVGGNWYGRCHHLASCTAHYPRRTRSFRKLRHLGRRNYVDLRA